MIYWVFAALALPIPAYFACGVGLLLGMASNTLAGAVIGWVLLPPLFCFAALSLTAPLFTRPNVR
ncbi:MAG: hypothetical protein EPO51_02150 [Phenylobacterium sp.]|uniref:hypothetical protein n=1 Tax=Phenylobacterium sp. TaxID=1871053 RepID=UPI00121E2A8C|nr:hypothetical protein [Phenylobacterium sp.]TAJ74880.1 MAG: hypothetical protein EPO51_02150 [Phenylobacterium sp.]